MRDTKFLTTQTTPTPGTSTAKEPARCTYSGQADGEARDEDYMSKEKTHARRLLNRVPGTFILVTSLNDLFGGGKYKGLTQNILDAAEEVRQMMLCFDNVIVVGPGRAETWGR